MHTSPITKWDGATAYFTLANNNFAIWLMLLASIAFLIAIIWYGTHHETADFEKIKRRG
ncbi:hypothetical protein LQ948_15175 [Jiella sp. MQZ9-1]|uniref:Uncharacterized protein n=1 Tax=Jiella flava TaxID=2816857 RepID=A0A939FYM9_9HYPH|nr:hypothetical protein [Jiella flava]MBO0663975.1 hypothetical protein [Jiella flava]MCD2472546.1 hypothetical protein [Jiella flava]